MPERMIEGVRIQMTANKKLDFDYDLGDVKALYRRGDWRNWQDEVRWLEQFGERDNELTPGQTVAMVEDLRSLQASKAPFTSDPNQAFQMAHRFRSENNRKYAQEHEQARAEARAMRRGKR
jgi:hypothetical protein